MQIGIIGQGFVGGAVYHKFQEFYNVLTYDIDPTKCNSTLKNVVDKCDFIFMCLPTPMGNGGACDTTIVRESMSTVNGMTTFPKVIILKSTVPPYTCDNFNYSFPNLRVVFNPEFLTAINAVEDFANQDRIILGGNPIDTKAVADLFRPLFPYVPIVQTSCEVAEMTKYVVNCFLAMKVSFANEIYAYCKEMMIPYEDVIHCAILDKRLGNSHWSVPGYDGNFGFGGTCFPKDVNALIAELGLVGLDSTMLTATWKKNLLVRPNIMNEKW